jgi:hypothetical protein
LYVLKENIFGDIIFIQIKRVIKDNEWNSSIPHVSYEGSEPCYCGQTQHVISLESDQKNRQER